MGQFIRTTAHKELLKGRCESFAIVNLVNSIYDVKRDVINLIYDVITVIYDVLSISDDFTVLFKL